jgi:hypothetical protein
VICMCIACKTSDPKSSGFRQCPGPVLASMIRTLNLRLVTDKNNLNTVTVDVDSAGPRRWSAGRPLPPYRPTKARAQPSGPALAHAPPLGRCDRRRTGPHTANGNLKPEPGPAARAAGPGGPRNMIIIR